MRAVVQRVSRARASPGGEIGEGLLILHRPSFAGAARPETAEPLYDRFCDALRELGVTVAIGVFGAHMSIELVNDGPVTLVLG